MSSPAPAEPNELCAGGERAGALGSQLLQLVHVADHVKEAAPRLGARVVRLQRCRRDAPGRSGMPADTQHRGTLGGMRVGMRVGSTGTWVEVRALHCPCASRCWCSSRYCFFSSSRPWKIFIVGFVMLSGMVALVTGDIVAPLERKLLTLFPVLAEQLFLKEIWMELEFMGEGVTWGTLTKPINGVSTLDLYVFQVLSILLWTCLHMYLDQVVPQDFGVPRKPWFFLQGSFWREMCADPRKLAAEKVLSGGEDDASQYQGSAFFVRCRILP